MVWGKLDGFGRKLVNLGGGWFWGKFDGLRGKLVGLGGSNWTVWGKLVN